MREVKVWMRLTLFPQYSTIFLIIKQKRRKLLKSRVRTSKGIHPILEIPDSSNKRK